MEFTEVLCLWSWMTLPNTCHQPEPEVSTQWWAPNTLAGFAFQSMDSYQDSLASGFAVCINGVWLYRVTCVCFCVWSVCVGLSWIPLGFPTLCLHPSLPPRPQQQQPSRCFPPRPHLIWMEKEELTWRHTPPWAPPSLSALLPSSLGPVGDSWYPFPQTGWYFRRWGWCQRRCRCSHSACSSYRNFLKRQMDI